MPGIVHAPVSAPTTEQTALGPDKHYVQSGAITLRMLADEVTSAMGGQAGPHTHAESDVTDLSTDLAGKSATAHNHDAAYATSAHTHATYAASSHNHDASYAPTHAHPYAGTVHEHDAAYSTVAHTHASYAASVHAHDSAYAALAHGHAPVYALLGNGTTAIAFGTNGTAKVTPTGNATLTTTVPAAGTHVHLLVLTSGSSSWTLTFGTGFKAVGTLATGVTTARVFVVAFVSDGTSLYESSRTAAMVA